MKATCPPRAGVATAGRALGALADRLALPVPREARVGADLLERSARGRPWPERAPLLRTADGWVHPGPPTAWPPFTDMTVALGTPAPANGAPLPDLTALS